MILSYNSIRGYNKNLMINYKSTFSKIKSLSIFAFPIIMGNLGQMLIGAGDVFVAARHSAKTVAAISIGNAITATILIIGIGLLLSISPVLSKKRGEKQDIKHYFKISILYALFLSLITGIIALATVPIIPLIGFEKQLIPNIQNYIYICSFSFAGAYLYQVLKEFLQTYERVGFANAVSIIGIFLNLLLCWIFVFGKCGIPSIGVSGLAVATLIVRSLMGLSLLCYCWKYFKAEFAIDTAYLKELFRIGYPMALSLILEFSAFNAITLIAGKIGTIPVAAHNIALTLASVTFMVPLAISNALGVKVGYAYGAKNYNDIKENFFAGLAISLCFMCVFAFLYFTVPTNLIGFFSADKEIILTGSSLLFIIAIFQVFDGVQVTISGALRGLGYTKPIFATMLIGYWIIGIPIGIYLAFFKKLSIYGLWIGLALSIFVCSIVFSIFLHKKLKEIKTILSLNRVIDVDLL